MTEVMMFGGRRDGEILVVPGGVEPISKQIQFTMKEEDLVSAKKVILLDIVPRKAKVGPKWKIELPKELW